MKLFINKKTAAVALLICCFFAFLSGCLSIMDGSYSRVAVLSITRSHDGGVDVDTTNGIHHIDFSMRAQEIQIGHCYDFSQEWKEINCSQVTYS